MKGECRYKHKCRKYNPRSILCSKTAGMINSMPNKPARCYRDQTEREFKKLRRLSKGV